MCVAIVAPMGHRVQNLKLYAGWTRNKDGAGFAYVDNGKVVISKGYMTYNAFEKAYSAAYAQFGETSAFLVHMRIRSAGDLNAANTHPFPVAGGALIHNGTLFQPTGDKIGPSNDRWSDTRGFASELHDKLTLENARLAKESLEKLIGNYNKIAMLYDSGDYVILNETGGEWVEDIWYSNSWSCRVQGVTLPTTTEGTEPAPVLLLPNPDAV